MYCKRYMHSSETFWYLSVSFAERVKSRDDNLQRSGVDIRTRIILYDIHNEILEKVLTPRELIAMTISVLFFCFVSFIIIIIIWKGNWVIEISQILEVIVEVSELTEINYSKLFGESRFKTIKHYSNYSPMLKWWTVGGTIEINGQKLLKCSNYLPMLNYMCLHWEKWILVDSTRKKLVEK